MGCMYVKKLQDIQRFMFCDYCEHFNDTDEFGRCNKCGTCYCSSCLCPEGQDGQLCRECSTSGNG